MKKFYLIIVLFICIYEQTCTASMPSMPNPESAVVDLSGYATSDRWEFDKNGAILSPEYIAYLFKFLPAAQCQIIRLESTQERYTLICFDPTASCYIGGWRSLPLKMYPADNITAPRIDRCTPLICSSNNPWILPFGPDSFCNRNAYLEKLPPASTTDLETHLQTHLNNLAHEIAKKAFNKHALYTPGSAAAYDALFSSATSDQTVYEWSVGKFGHYYNLIASLIPIERVTTEPYPISDTSAVMFDKPSDAFFKHPLYLYFAANKYAREQFINTETDVFKLLVMTVLLHRFKELDDIVFSESINNNQAYDDYYECLVIMSKLLPENTNLPALFKDWDQGNAATIFTSIDTQVIITARSAINPKMSDAVNSLYEEGIITVGKLFTAPPAGQASRGPQFITH